MLHKDILLVSIGTCTAISYVDKNGINDEFIKELINEENKIIGKEFILELKENEEGHLVVDAPLNIGYSDLQKLFRHKGSDSLCILVSTLGSAIDKRTSILAQKDASRMILLDACANAYIEEVTNDYQKRLNLGEETFRFAPGYGDVPLSVQREIFEFMPEISKIGIELDDSNLMHPFKSMTGFIGFKAGK